MCPAPGLSFVGHSAVCRPAEEFARAVKRTHYPIRQNIRNVSYSGVQGFGENRDHQY